MSLKGFTMAQNTKSEIEVDRLIEELRAKGANIVKEPQKANWGGYVATLPDRDLEIYGKLPTILSLT